MVLILSLAACGFLGFRYYNEPVRKAFRSLHEQGVSADSSSAVEAAKSNRIPVLRNLLTVGVALHEKSQEGSTPLIAAVKTRSLGAVDLLLSQPAVRQHVDTIDEGASWTALGHALEARNYELARQLLKAGADPDVELVEGVPLLVESLQVRDLKLFRFLLDAGADPNAVTQDGQSCLALAVGQQNGEWFGLLEDAGVSASTMTPGGEPLLIEQVRLGNDDQVAALLDAGADPNAVASSGATSLMAALQIGDLTMVNLLLDRGADPSQANARGRAPLSFALEQGGDLALVKSLLHAGADVGDEALVHEAYATGNIEILRSMLDMGAPAEARNRDGVRLLEVAVEAGQFAVADLVLEHGADCEGMLWPSLRSGKDEVLKLVLKHGADVRKKDGEGQEPIAYALANDRASAVDILLAAGASANADHPDGGTWLAHLIVAGKNEMALSFLKHGACFEGEKASDGISLLAWAIANGAGDVAEKLITDGADVMEPLPSPASEAFREKFGSKTFRYYLQSDRGINPLMVAAAKKNHQAARALVKAGAKPSVYTKRKTLWPVNIAAWFGDVEMMRIMFGKYKPDGRKIIVDLSSQKATFYDNGKVLYSTRVSTGKSGYRTPPGHYVVTNKHRSWNSTIYGSSMPYFLRLSCGSFGLHQGYVPSYPASHGCIRVPAGNAKSIFYIAELGDEVVIQK